MHRHNEGDPNPPWRERSLAHLLAATRRYAANLAGAWRRLPSLAWPSHDLDHEWEVDGVSWTCTELTTSVQLSEESAAMQHCVATYATRCANGSSAIVSRTAKPSPASPARSSSAVTVHSTLDRWTADQLARLVD